MDNFSFKDSEILSGIEFLKIVLANGPVSNPG
jgi:hypothetical protein